jgi:outer membrane protein TolC
MLSPRCSLLFAHRHRLPPVLLLLAAMAAVFGVLPVCGQQTALRLNDAVRQALERYGSVQVTEAQVAEAAASLRLARTAYLPRVDATAQANRATRNNVFGLLFPQGFPPVSGPPLEQNSTSNVWGSFVGFLVAWEPFDFGLRKANEEVAKSAERRAAAAVVRSRYELSALVADSYLTALAAEQTLLQAEASVRRAEVFERVVEALVNAKLRPGVELSRAKAETAAARIQQFQARRAVDVAKALLARLIQVEPAGMTLLPGRLSDPPPAALSSRDLASHPVTKQQQAAVDEAAARIRSIEKTWAPRFQVLATVYARGTGARSNGETLGGVGGLGPNIHNWAVGLGVTFPILERSSLRAKQDIEAARLREESKKREQLLADLTGQLNAALAFFSAAREIAESMPDLLESARAAERQAVARYRAGLGNAIDVADAQRQLAQAEVDSAVARLSVWRALLGVAKAHGDVESFVKEASQ